LPSVQLHDEADPVIKKMTATIAAMMENPASAKFGEMKRAVKKAGKLDCICLSLHGAMVTATEDDAEGALLEALRRIVACGYGSSER
jgi:microcystin degradation protein MlrC